MLKWFGSTSTSFDWLRVGLGLVLIILGIIVVAGVSASRHSLPQIVGLIPQKDRIVYIPKKEIVIQTPTGEIGSTGPTTVMARWQSTMDANKGSSVGEYQFENNDHVIQVLRFCNDPPVDLGTGWQVEVEYMPNHKDETIKESLQTDRCVLMVKAKVLNRPTVLNKK